MRRLGSNADGELLEPGRVRDWYLPILLDQSPPSSRPSSPVCW